ncbi:MAG: patatin-like phospholipase family protein [Betaproteobacteria bacterium]
MAARPKLALVLSGGGARAAYQAGVLQAIAERTPRDIPSPFAIVCGTSAGAINAAAMAAGALHFYRATSELQSLWSALRSDDIYRTDRWHLAKTGGRWLMSFMPGLTHRRPGSLLDNTPLGALLERVVPFAGVRAAQDAGVLEAFAVTAMSYHSGMSVTFCDARPEVVLWERAQRIGVRAKIGVPHLLASSAIPFVFAPSAIDGEYFGDGAVRQVTPTAPALHLGADRILVIGAARSSIRPEPPQSTAPPSVAQIGGQVLASIFTDALGTDLEKVRLINAAVRQIPADRLAASPVPLRDVAMTVVTPSVALEEVALAHVAELPGAIRVLLSSVGGTGEGGAGLLSYLLFEPGYCRALIQLGYADAQSKRDEIDALLAGAF